MRRVTLRLDRDAKVAQQSRLAEADRRRRRGYVEPAKKPSKQKFRIADAGFQTKSRSSRRRLALDDLAPGHRQPARAPERAPQAAFALQADEVVAGAMRGVGGGG